MSAAGWLCGQAPTLSNAQALIGRLHRAAALRPAEAQALRQEAAVIQELFLASALPAGRPTAILSFLQPRWEEQPKPIFTSWHFLYSALTGRKPPSAPHNARIAARWGQFYFLSADGKLTMGHSLRRSMALPRAEREALLAKGQANLRPKKTVVATLSDLEGLFHMSKIFCSNFILECAFPESIIYVTQGEVSTFTEGELQEALKWAKSRQEQSRQEANREKVNALLALVKQTSLSWSILEAFRQLNQRISAIRYVKTLVDDTPLVVAKDVVEILWDQR